MRPRWHWSTVVIALPLLVSLLLPGAAGAEDFANPAFRRVWERSDLPVQQGRVARSWVWGPEPFTPGIDELYERPDSEGRQVRLVQYFDKSRMEINNPEGNPNDPWFVTNGLLVNEMITGSVAVSDTRGIPLPAANIPIAGDPTNAFPTYASLIRPFNTPIGRPMGSHVTNVFLPEGAGEFPQYATSPATEIVRLERGFGIPRAFWEFANRRGVVYQNNRYVEGSVLGDWVFVLGLPTTDAFWTRVRVGGVERDVMFQGFERRILTYTPDNPEGWQVEMGNVGRHYHQWRYEDPFANGRRALITNPARGETPPVVSSPLLVQGFENGTAFEAAIVVRLRRISDGAVLAQQPTMVARPDVTIPGPFEARLTFTPPAGETRAMLEVFMGSPRDGSEIMLDSFEVRVHPSG